jgi:hypothetical protein
MDTKMRVRCRDKDAWGGSGRVGAEKFSIDDDGYALVSPDAKRDLLDKKGLWEDVEPVVATASGNTRKVSGSRSKDAITVTVTGSPLDPPIVEGPLKEGE